MGVADKKKRCITEIVLFILVMIVFNIVNSKLYPLVQNIGGDELSTIGIAAVLWGEDWNNVLNSCKYYGFGYSFFLAPIFKITDNPIYIYRFMHFINSIINSVSVLLCYRIASKILRNTDNMYSFFISLVVAFLPGKFNYVLNEHMIILMIWLSMYLVMKIQESEKEKKCIILLIVLLSYGLTIHTRMLILLITITGYITLFYWNKKKDILKIYYIGIFLGGFLTNNILIKGVQNLIWSQNKGTNYIANTSEALIDKIFLKMENIFSINSIKFIVTTFISQIITGNILTVGLLLLAMFTAIIYTYQIIAKIKKIEHIEVAISWICIWGIVISVLGTIMIWLPGFEGMDPIQSNETINKGRVKLYIRYYFCYQGEYFNLDIFEDGQDIGILEINIGDDEEVVIPDFVSVLEKVSNNELYFNKNIAKKNSKKQEKKA